MNKIICNHDKILKLTNVLKYKLLVNEDNFDFNTAIEQMASYIKVKGTIQVGPLIQYTRTLSDDLNQVHMEIIMIMQCNNFIHKVEEPFNMESIIRVANCMYCRYIGPEEKIKVAYDKIGVEAFEADIELTGESYTIYVDQNEENDTITTDIFMPKKNI